MGRRLHWLVFAFALFSWSLPAAARIERIGGSGSSDAGVFRAGPEGAKFRLAKDTQLALQPGARVRMFSTPQFLKLGPGPRTRTFTVVVVEGQVSTEIEGNHSAVLFSLAPKFNAIVKGGTATASARHAGGAIRAGTGEVLVAPQGAYVPLPPGKVMVFEGGQASERATLPAPTVQADQRVFVTTDRRAQVHGVRWQPVAGATGYRVDLVREGTRIASRRQSQTDLTTPLAASSAGQYELQVVAFDDWGLPGEPSRPLALSVVAPEVPAGAFVDRRGVIRLGRGQRVTLKGAESLLIQHGREGRFQRVRGPEVGLFENERTTVFLRFSDSIESERLQLAPRGITARIRFDQQRAVWPGNPLGIRVRLTTRDRSPVPSSIEPEFKVRIGIDTVDVRFERRGNDWVASLPARNTDGPWVVRVEVSDQHGVSLGRNFLEVARAEDRPAKVARKR